MAKRRIKNLDELYMGPEPDFRTTPPPTDEKERQTAYSKAAHWYYYFTNKNLYVKEVINYCKDVLKFNKEEIQAMKCLPDWKVYMKSHAFVKMTEIGWDFNQEEINKHQTHLKETLLPEGKELLKEKSKVKESKPKPIVISPHERQRIKVMNTIAGDWDEMVIDKWMEGVFDKKLVKFPTYSLFQVHGLKGSAVSIFKDIVMEEYTSIKHAYDKTDDQCVEAYSHITKGNKRKMLDIMDGIFEDIERVKEAAKSARTVNKKPKARDAQVKKLNYLKDHEDSKVVSINPVLIPSAGWLWTYNTKTKRLTEFKTNSTEGFEVRGSTLQKWDQESSRTSVLRKPLDVLPLILTKSIKQIDNVWKGLTTKVTKPTGRINKDTILLRTEEYVR
jgi:hypothetical protein